MSTHKKTRPHPNSGFPALEDDDVRFIIDNAYQPGHSQAQLAERFGVAKGTIAAVQQGRTYPHIQAEYEDLEVGVDDEEDDGEGLI